LGTGIDVVDYDQALERIEAWAEDGRQARLVGAANTHLVAEAHQDPGFADVLEGFDLVAPDGMPLVWALWLDGWPIRDRVYGPYLMDFCLRRLSDRRRHAFVGGTAECLKRLQVKAKEANPGIQIVAAISPPFGVWDEAVNEKLIGEIHASGADVVWLALGGVRQETWLASHRQQLPPAVYLAVGDAFVLLAGLRSYAPAGVQKLGLTWLFRLCQEPRRLAVRYFKYNLLFVSAFLRERWLKTHGAEGLIQSK
jgi:N-acetylglucosaminyldiphosphoundecaprenol N-acetyl-beta-D-mannosaminyltransferase